MLGGSVSGAASSESFGWSISVPAAYGTAAIDLLADVTQHPTLADDTLETERSVALADVIAVRDDMYRYPMRLALQAAFAGHPYGTPASGTEQSLKRIGAAELREWHAARVCAGQSVVAIVGDGDLDGLAAAAARAFAELKPGREAALSAPRWPTEVVQRAEERERAQTALAMLFSGPARMDPDRYAASLIATVASGLGGRFFDELRDKQSLCYTVNAFAGERRLAGTFGAYIATSPAKESAARDGLLAEFARLRDEPVTNEELERARTYALGVHAISQQHGGAVLGDLIDAWSAGDLEELTEFENRLGAVTAADMQRVAREHFVESRRVEGIVRGTRTAAV
jgi:zinc protease